MRGVLVLLSVLLGSAAFASQCPDLTGKYLCTYVDDDGNDQEEIFSVTQEAKSGVTTYTAIYASGEQSTITADGVERVQKTEEEGFFIVGSDKSLCEKDTLRIISNFQVAFDPELETKFAEIDVESSVYVHNDQLTTMTNSKTWQKDPETGEEKVEENSKTEVCSRI